MTQVSYFQPGAGCVIHKARLPESPCKFSAWFAESGVLLDAERIDRLGRANPVGVLQRRALQRRFGYLATMWGVVQ